MLAMVLMMALAAGGGEETCAGHVSTAAFEMEMLEDLEAEAYAEAEADFEARFEELGLAGSTLGREEARAAAETPAYDTSARNQ